MPLILKDANNEILKYILDQLNEQAMRAISRGKHKDEMKKCNFRMEIGNIFAIITVFG